MLINCWRGASARASDGSGEVCSWPSGSAGRHSSILRLDLILQLSGPRTGATTLSDPLGPPDDLQGPAGFFCPIGTQACVCPTLAVFNSGIRLRLVHGRGPVSTIA